MSNEEKKFSTALARINDTFLPMIVDQLEGNGVNMDGYSKQCVLSALSAINATLSTKGIDWNDKQLDKSNVTQVLMDIACMKLNASASPREIYFKMENVPVKDNKGAVVEWKKQVKMDIEGDGNDSILAHFGRDVKKVCQFWVVREGDHFEYPKYNGLEMTPPQWTPTGKGNVVRVVYPIVKSDGLIEYYIGERDDVARNLLAHINNNLMNETFGICEDRKKATPKQKSDIAAKKKAIMKKAQELGLDALDDDELQAWISPAWTEYQSKEQMITRKIRNNIVKKIPKDFGNAYIEMIYNDHTDMTEKLVEQEVFENANSEVIDVQATIVEKPEPEQEPASQEQGQPTEPPPQTEPGLGPDF